MKLDELKDKIGDAGLDIFRTGNCNLLGWCIVSCNDGCNQNCSPGCSSSSCQDCTKSCSSCSSQSCASGCSSNTCTSCVLACSDAMTIGGPIILSR